MICRKWVVLNKRAQWVLFMALGLSHHPMIDGWFGLIWSYLVWKSGFPPNLAMGKPEWPPQGCPTSSTARSAHNWACRSHSWTESSLGPTIIGNPVVPRFQLPMVGALSLLKLGPNLVQPAKIAMGPRSNLMFSIPGN